MSETTSADTKKPFATTRPCSYTEHAARIAKMMAEGLHDGQHWKPEAHARYAELESLDAALAPLVEQLAQNPATEAEVRRGIEVAKLEDGFELTAPLVEEAPTEWPEIPNYLGEPIVFEDKSLGICLLAKWGGKQWIFRVHNGSWCSVRDVNSSDPLFVTPLKRREGHSKLTGRPLDENGAIEFSLPSAKEGRADDCNCGVDPKHDCFAPPWAHAVDCPYRTGKPASAKEGAASQPVEEIVQQLRDHYLPRTEKFINLFWETETLKRLLDAASQSAEILQRIKAMQESWERDNATWAEVAAENTELEKVNAEIVKELDKLRITLDQSLAGINQALASRETELERAEAAEDKLSTAEELLREANEYAPKTLQKRVDAYFATYCEDFKHGKKS